MNLQRWKTYFNANETGGMCPIASFYGANKRFLREQLKLPGWRAHRGGNQEQLTVVIARGYQYVQRFAVRAFGGASGVAYNAWRFSNIADRRALASKVLFSGVPMQWQAKQGPMNYNLEAGFGRKSYRVPRGAWMAAFAAVWGLLTILVVLQDHAIDAQRKLIELLMEDMHTALTTSIAHGSVSSAPIVVKAVQLPDNQVQKQETPSVQVPQSKVQAKAKGSTRVPSSQGKDANSGRNSRQAKEKLPVRPPAEYTDPSDMRRVRFSI